MRKFLFAFGVAIALFPQQALASCGIASFYHDWYEGKTTSSGRPFRQNSNQAAHPSAPFGTRYRVTNSSTGASTVVVITDRGPFVGGRIIDLSRSSFSRIAPLSQGLAQVCLQRL